jgi:hypothetical protein
MIQVRPTATCEHTLQYTRRWKKELDRFWLIQSTECIILMYIPQRIPDHVCVTANELLLLTYPLIVLQEEHNQQEGKSCKCGTLFEMSAVSHNLWPPST